MVIVFAGMATMYVRYKQVEALLGVDDLKLLRLNCIGLWLGWTSSFGMCVVANFQVRAAAGLESFSTCSGSDASIVSSVYLCVCLSRRPPCSPCTSWGRFSPLGSGLFTSCFSRCSLTTCSLTSTAGPSTCCASASDSGPWAASSAVSLDPLTLCSRHVCFNLKQAANSGPENEANRSSASYSSASTPKLAFFGKCAYKTLQN